MTFRYKLHFLILHDCQIKEPLKWFHVLLVLLCSAPNIVKNLTTFGFRLKCLFLYLTIVCVKIYFFKLKFLCMTPTTISSELTWCDGLQALVKVFNFFAVSCPHCFTSLPSVFFVE